MKLVSFDFVKVTDGVSYRLEHNTVNMLTGGFSVKVHSRPLGSVEGMSGFMVKNIMIEGY